MSDSSDGNGHPRTPPDLRELARRIQEETDSNKMIELVQQLIAKFDEQELQKARARTQIIGSQGPSETPAESRSDG
jgi:hypothetical protein